MPETRMLQTLAEINAIGAQINAGGAGAPPDLPAVLARVAECAAQLVPGASAAVRLDDLALDAAASGRAGDLPPADGFTRFPLVSGGQTVGALVVQLPAGRKLGEEESLLLTALANQAAAAHFQARWLAGVQRDLARKDEELNRLRRAGLLISSRLRLEETLEAILQMALEVTGARYGIVRLLDRGAANLVTGAIAGEHLDRPLVENLPVDSNSVMGWVARHRQPALIADLRAEPWARIYYPLDAILEMRAELAVPLLGAGGRLEGVLNLESPQVGAFSEADSHLLQSLATQAVIAIQEVRLLDALQEAAQLLLAQPSRLVLDRLVELAGDLLNASSSGIFLYVDEQLQPVTAANLDGALLGLHSRLAGTAARERRAASASLPDGAGSALAVPLLAGEQVVGAFSAVNSGSASGAEWENKVLTCLAHYAALAVQGDAHREALQAAQEQRAVAETFAVVGDVAANLLHHLNNKVGTIPVRIQGIEDKCQPALQADPYLAANLREIERSASEAMRAVRENLSHLGSITLAEVDVAGCARAGLAAARLPAGIQVHLEALESLPVVVAGQQSLALVFSNLLENAADAMRGVGEITVRGRARPGWVEVAVSDNGPGISPELHDSIFELNFSGRGGAQGKLGFGLWWVKTLMTRLGGAVTVESDGRHGATFWLRLPMAEKRA